MSTISFSVEDEIKREVAAWAKRAKKSKSDLFRDMATVYRFNDQLDQFTSITESKLAELGVTSEQELYDFLESDETYKSRLRQQRLPRSPQAG
ncbi:MAG: ribbon-helix-helix protein, CopG family [Candidatus Saccharimonadales bacterium]